MTSVRGGQGRSRGKKVLTSGKSVSPPVCVRDSSSLRPYIAEILGSQCKGVGGSGTPEISYTTCSYLVFQASVTVSKESLTSPHPPPKQLIKSALVN